MLDLEEKPFQFILQDTFLSKAIEHVELDAIIFVSQSISAQANTEKRDD